jgi:O-antigen/teichoic acid export membrane protein
MSDARQPSAQPEQTEPETAQAQKPHKLYKTLVSLVWIYGGRGAGLLWTLALTFKLGVDQYGLYGLGFAISSIVGPTLNQPFAVRMVRESEEEFRAERTARYLLGLALIAVGLALMPVTYIAFFGLTIAGAELTFNTYKARAARDGHPDITWRWDSYLRLTAISLGGIYLFAVPHPTLLGASLLYLVPYLVPLVLAGIQVRHHRPSLPRPPRQVLALMGEMLGMTAFLQGDVLLLGWLTNSTIVGYYNLAFVPAVAIATVGLSYGGTYAEPLRDSGGQLSSGPRLRNTVALGLVAGSLLLIVGLVLFATPAPTQVAAAMVILAGFTAFRTITSVFQSVLYAQRRDVLRLSANIGLVPIKLALVAALSFLGAIGAATATTVIDGVMLGIFAYALYGKKWKKP